METVLSVIMSTYNRENMVLETIESVLNQTFRDFEFIIIDDNSTDNTSSIIKNIKDSRIKLIQNTHNCGCTINYRLAHNISKGKYIAHTDDDDISFPDRFEKQINFMESNPQIALSGTFIETFGENRRPDWVFYTNPDIIDFVCNLYNPICHSSIIYRKTFMDENFINYNPLKKCAQDYDFYKQILLKGGKIANIDEILVKYRMHKNRLTDIKETQDIQIYNAEVIRKELLLRYFNDTETEDFLKLIKGFPYNEYNKTTVIEGINKLGEKIPNSNNIIKQLTEDIINNRFTF